MIIREEFFPPSHHERKWLKWWMHIEGSKMNFPSPEQRAGKCFLWRKEAVCWLGFICMHYWKGLSSLPRHVSGHFMNFLCAQAGWAASITVSAPWLCYHSTCKAQWGVPGRSVFPPDLTNFSLGSHLSHGVPWTQDPKVSLLPAISFVFAEAVGQLECALSPARCTHSPDVTVMAGAAAQEVTAFWVLGHTAFP